MMTQPTAVAVVVLVEEIRAMSPVQVAHLLVGVDLVELKHLAVLLVVLMGVQEQRDLPYKAAAAVPAAVVDILAAVVVNFILDVALVVLVGEDLDIFIQHYSQTLQQLKEQDQRQLLMGLLKLILYLHKLLQLQQ